MGQLYGLFLSPIACFLFGLLFNPRVPLASWLARPVSRGQKGTPQTVHAIKMRVHEAEERRRQNTYVFIAVTLLACVPCICSLLTCLFPRRATVQLPLLSARSANGAAPITTVDQHITTPVNDERHDESIPRTSETVRVEGGWHARRAEARSAGRVPCADAPDEARASQPCIHTLLPCLYPVPRPAMS